MTLAERGNLRLQLICNRNDVARVVTIPILTRGIVTKWRFEHTRNRKSNLRFYSKIGIVWNRTPLNCIVLSITGQNGIMLHYIVFFEYLVNILVTYGIQNVGWTRQNLNEIWKLYSGIHVLE